MRRILFASLFAFAPVIAYAQTAADRPPPPPPPGAFHDGMPPDMRAMMAFYAANTSHDGHLTLAQAKAANFKLVVDHFKEIDVDKRDYVTFYDIQAWKLDQFARHLEKQADALRAMDNKQG